MKNKKKTQFYTVLTNKQIKTAINKIKLEVIKIK